MKKEYDPHLADGLKKAGLWDPSRMVVKQPARPWRKPIEVRAVEPVAMYALPPALSPIPDRDLRLSYVDDHGQERTFSLKALARAMQLPAPVSPVSAATGGYDVARHASGHKRKTRHGVRGVAGRDGRAADLVEVDALTLTVTAKTGMLKILFDQSHPIERIRLGGGFKRKSKAKRDDRIDEADRPHLRYCAARFWSEDYEIAHGKTGFSSEFGERVDASPVRGGLQERLLIREGSYQAARASVTAKQALILDAICGRGESISEVARKNNAHHSTVSEALISGLDRLIHAYDYSRFEHEGGVRARRGG